MLLTRNRFTGLLAGIGLVAGCAVDDGPGDGGSFGQEDLVAAVVVDAAIAALLPADVRAAGVLTFGSTVGAPPISFYAEDNKTPKGVDIDMADGVAKVLGVRVDRQKVGGEAILTGLRSDRFQVATANFAVTEERKQVLDFVTYVRDGAGFLTRRDRDLGEVTDLEQLCGLVVGTGKGTTFEVRLDRGRAACTAAGREPYAVNTYSDTASQLLAVKEGRVDVLMSTASALKHMAGVQDDLRFLNQFTWQDIGFGLKKGSPLAPAIQAAVNKLIADGVYARILAKWGLDDAGVAQSEINPPERGN